MDTRIKPLTRKEELETIIKAKAGDEDAIMLLIKSNMGLIIQWITKCRSGNEYYDFSDDDALQEVSIAILKSIKTFDPKLGNRFTTYIRLPILHTLQMYNDYLRGVGKGSTALITSVQTHGSKILKKKRYLKKSFEAMKKGAESHINSRCYAWEGVNTKLTPHQLITYPDIPDNSIRDTIKNILSPREYCTILSRSFGLGLRDIAKSFGVTHQRISQIENDGKRNIKNYLQRKNITQY